MTTIFIKELMIKTIIGVHEWERRLPQRILVDLEIDVDTHKAAVEETLIATIDYEKLAEHITRFVQDHHCFLLETLVELLADDIETHFLRPLVETNRTVPSQLRLTLSKPGAVANAKNVGLSTTRVVLAHPLTSAPKTVTVADL